MTALEHLEVLLIIVVVLKAIDNQSHNGPGSSGGIPPFLDNVKDRVTKSMKKIEGKDNK